MVAASVCILWNDKSNILESPSQQLDDSFRGLCPTTIGNNEDVGLVTIDRVDQVNKARYVSVIYSGPSALRNILGLRWRNKAGAVCFVPRSGGNVSRRNSNRLVVPDFDRKVCNSP